MPGLLFYTIITGLASGILFRSFFELRLLDIVFVLLLSFTFVFLWWLRQRPYKSIFFVSSIFLLAFGIGIMRIDLSEREISPLRNAMGETKIWEGIVVREPDIREDTTHLYIREAETEHLVLVTTDPFTRVAYGDRISVRGALSEPEPFTTETGRIFNYRGYLKAHGVREVIIRGDVEVLESGKGNPVLNRLFLVKQALIESIERAVGEPAAGLGEGILLGVKRALGDDLTQIFRTAGIIHIVVLSGYNIMIVADFVMRFLGQFFFPRTRLFIGVSVIALFALLVGPTATVVRASLMAVLVLIARATGRQYAVLRALFITGALMLFVNPYLIAFDPGFQLSFLATLGLILLTPRLEERFMWAPTFGGVRGYLASTIGTQIFVLPILLFSMGTFSLVSVLVNILVLPLVPLAMLVTFIVGVVGLVSETAAVVVGFLAYAILMYIINVAGFAAALPFAEVVLPPFHVGFVLLMFAGIVWLTIRLTQAQKKLEEGTETSSPVENDYAGWTIETAKSPTAASADGDTEKLPFK